MKRFCAFLLLTLVIDASASAAEPICGDADDAKREQQAILNGILGTSKKPTPPKPMLAPKFGTLPVIAAKRPAAKPGHSGSQRYSAATAFGATEKENAAHRPMPAQAWRISSSKSTKRRADLRISKAVKQPAKISVKNAQPIGISVVDRLKARGEARSRIRRVGYDIEDLQRLLEGQSNGRSSASRPLPIQEAPDDFTKASVEPSVESEIPAFEPEDDESDALFDFEETYQIAAPPRPETPEKSPSDEVESVLDQLRRELRKEMEDAKKAEEAAREKRRQTTVESVIPRSAPQRIENAANSSLDLTLDLEGDDDDEGLPPEPDVTGLDGETPPIPDSFDEVPRNPSHWNDTPWAFGREMTDMEIYNPCEPVYCQQMWDCAGGRCQTWLERAMRSIDRTTQVTYGKCHDCGRIGANSCVPGNREICSPAFHSRCNVGVWRRSPRRVAAARVTNGDFLGSKGIGLVSCTESCTLGGCTEAGSGSEESDSSCTDAAGCTSQGCTGSCSTLTSDCGKGCDRCSMDTEPWSIWGSLFPCEPRVNLSGWVSAGYHSRANGRFNDHPDAFNLHQSWFALERVADTSRRSLDWGFRFDAMYGVDGADTQGFSGHPGQWDFQNGFDHGRYAWALPQAYGEIAFGDTSVIVGHFYTLIGYEVVPAPDNFFYSHSMTMYLSEPFTHTGVLARKTHSDVLESYYGWTLGWDTGFDQVQNGNSFLGGVKMQLSENFSATYITSFGDFGTRGTGYAHSMVFAANPSDQWGVVFQSDLLRVHEEDNVSASAYVMRHLTDFASIGSRVEWWKGDTVTGYAPFGINLPDNGTFSYCAATFGANFRLGTNITIRPEGRIDWSPALDYSVGTGGVDVVMTF